MKRKIFLVIIFFALGLFFIAMVFPEITLLTTLENIKASHDKWVSLYQDSPFKIISYFMLFNTVMAMLPIPGISMISLLGGSLFGFIPGMIYTSLATAIGNLGGFFLGRYLFQDYIYQRYGDKLIVFQEDWKRDGAIALFSLRLFPFIPSFVANFIMGVSSLGWWTFFWISWVGRIPMVLVYTWGGVQIAKINTLEDILSPKVTMAFIVMALLPWVLKILFKKRSDKGKI